MFRGLDPAHVASALLGVLWMALGLAAIVYRARRRFGRIERDSALMLLTYLLGIWLLYPRAGS